jgi:hypothetical protein
VLIALLPLLAAGTAGAWEPVDGERLDYVASWAGLEAGYATAVTHAVGAAWSTTLTSRSADWLARLYPVDDVVTSTWHHDGGSTGFDARYREGSFRQDLAVRFFEGKAIVTRRQEVRGTWEESASAFDVPAGVHDPLSAVLALRAEGRGDQVLQVSSGRRVSAVYVADVGPEPFEGVPARRLELRTREAGVLRDRITAWYADDAARTPVAAIVHTRAGAVTVRRRPAR